MKKIITFFAATCLSASLLAQRDSSASSKLGGLFKKANSILNSGKSTSASLSTDEIVSGLKEALTLGAQKSGDKLSAADGFFKDAVVKILMPPEAVKVEGKLRAIGMGSLIDNAILSMNRAAEDASKSAAPIFIDAVKKMTVQDAIGILRGPDTAATFYLKRTTSPQLVEAFRPVIEASLSKVNATKYWKDVFTTYNKISFTKVDTDLSSYVTSKALDGIFYYLGEEEKKIRTNPAERVSDILKKVFGSK
jgi:hypothetical protein